MTILFVWVFLRGTVFLNKFQKLIFPTKIKEESATSKLQLLAV